MPGGGDELYIFHLGWPEISARYNAVGRFGRVSEVASRVAGQLSGEGNSAAFREFALAVRQHHFPRHWWHSVSARTTC